MLDKSMEFISEGNLLAFSVAMVLGVLLNAQKILSFIDSYKKRRIELLKEAAEFPELSDKLKNQLNEEIESEYFRLAYRVKMDKPLREACLGLSEWNNSELPFKWFLRAEPHLILKRGTLLVTISKFEYFSYFYNMVLGVFMLLIGFSLIVILDNLTNPTVYSVLGWLGACGLSIIFGLFFLSQTYSVNSARKIKRVIEKGLSDISLEQVEEGKLSATQIIEPTN